MLTFGSVCSGIEAASVAWEPLGWQAEFLSEIEPFPRAVLAHHYPDVPLHGDFTSIQAGDYGPVDVLVGGTPCQSFSIAGLRKGMGDARGNLALEYLLLARRLRPRWLVWENVPGVLSSGRGRDFGSFLGGLVECGYGFAYRVLDAQYFGLAQRRKRVFVVGYLGNWRRAAAVLFEPESLRGDSAPRREKGARTAGTLAGVSPGGGWRCGADEAAAGQLVPFAAPFAPALSASNPYGDHESREGLLLAFGGNNTSRDGASFVPSVAGAVMPSPSRNRSPNEDATLLAFGGNNTSGPIDVATALLAQPGSGWKGDFESETFIASAGIETLQPPFDIVTYASAQERDAASLLSALREAIGAEAFAEWGSGISHSLRAQEVLRPKVHGGSLRREADEGRRGVDDGTLPCPAADASGSLRGLWKAGCERRSPPGRELPEQLAGELGEALSKLPHEGAQAEAFLLSLRRASEGAGLLQPPLHPTQGRAAVRRLTPREAERLQGFPDDYTLIPWRKGMAPDGPRYKALGNSMAVPVMRWIGERIAMVEGMRDD